MTKVLFLLEDDNSVLAVFPQLNYNKRMSGNFKKVCYSHIGQHSGCTKSYYQGLKRALPEQYQDLKSELESMGY